MSTVSVFTTPDSSGTFTFPGKSFRFDVTRDIESGEASSSAANAPFIVLPEARPIMLELTNGNAVPASVLLGSLQDYEHRLVSDIPLSVAEEEGVVAVSWDEIDEFGYGADLIAAIDDFRTSTIHLYVELHRDRDSLGQDLSRVYEVMRRHIVQRS